MHSVRVAPAFLELYKPHRHKVLYGGRGGAKSTHVADWLVSIAARSPERILCAREVQNSIKDSVKRLIDDRIAAQGLTQHFVSTDSEIRCPATGSVFIFSGLRINPEKIKSTEGVTKCWVEEAETVSERSLELLIPTIRKNGSELVFTFNPDRVSAPVYQKYVANTPPPDSWVKKVGWRENPWFPDVLREEMLHCREQDYDKYMHIWEGEPIKIARGSYYAKLLQRAQNDGRIDRVPYEPELPVNTAWDLGVSDSTAIWFFQVLPTARGVAEYRFIDYYESRNEGLQHYVGVVASKGFHYGVHIAPHDIKVRELGTGKTRLEQAYKMGMPFAVCPSIPLQDGIDVARGVVKRAWFDRDKCKAGLDCLWAYQREFDENSQSFKERPRHDWTSHGADAFRYAAVGYRNPLSTQRRGQMRPQTTINKRAGRY